MCRESGIAGGGGTKGHVCVYLGYGIFPKSPGVLDSRAPNTRWWCGWERDRVKVKTSAGDTCRGKTSWIPGLVSQSLLGLATALA